jgi:hypothetical protein
MEWGELRILYTQRRREALAATYAARAIRNSRERRTAHRWSWLCPFRISRLPRVTEGHGLAPEDRRS